MQQRMCRCLILPLTISRRNKCGSCCQRRHCRLPSSPGVERLRTCDSGCRSTGYLAMLPRQREAAARTLKVTEAIQEGHEERTINIQKEGRSKQQKNRKVFQHTHQFYINLIISRGAGGNDMTELHKWDVLKFQHLQERLRNLRIKKTFGLKKTSGPESPLLFPVSCHQCFFAKGNEHS